MLFMSNTRKTSGYLLPAAFLIALAFIGTVFLSLIPKHDTRLEVSENDESITVTASFPSQKSASVYNYLRSQLDVSDLSNFKWLEIKKYKTPDMSMSVYIKTRSKLLMIRMNKDENNAVACNKLKGFADGLKHVLALK